MPERDEVPRAEQVGRARLRHVQLAHDEAVADHEGEGRAGHGPQRLGLPRAAIELDGRDADAIARPDGDVAQRLGEVEVDVEQALPSHQGAIALDRCQLDRHVNVVPPRRQERAWWRPGRGYDARTWANIGEGPAGPQGPPHSATEYERAARALERSAQLADALAQHEHSIGNEAAAVQALAAARRARRAAERGRGLADQMRWPPL